jgi:hypothetical protein
VKYGRFFPCIQQEFLSGLVVSRQTVRAFGLSMLHGRFARSSDPMRPVRGVLILSDFRHFATPALILGPRKRTRLDYATT